MSPYTPASKKQHLSLADCSTIIFKLKNNIFSELDKEYEKVRKSNRIPAQTPLPTRELRRLQIIYGETTLQRAIDILKEKRIKPCLECPTRSGVCEFQQFQIQGSNGNIYHLPENAQICRCPAFKRLFFANAEKFQCKHILAIQLMKYFDSSFIPTPRNDFI